MYGKRRRAAAVTAMVARRGGDPCDRDWAETIIISFGPDKRDATDGLGTVARFFLPFSFFFLLLLFLPVYFPLPLSAFSLFRRTTRARSFASLGLKPSAPLYSSLIFNAHPLAGRPASVAGKRITYFDRPCSLHEIVRLPVSMLAGMTRGAAAENARNDYEVKAGSAFNGRHKAPGACFRNNHPGIL